MDAGWGRRISTKAAFLAVIVFSVLVVGYTAWRALSTIKEIEKHSLEARMIEQNILEDMQARKK